VPIALQIGDKDAIENFSKRTVKVMIILFEEISNEKCP